MGTTFKTSVGRVHVAITLALSAACAANLILLCWRL
jgi:hypothetical protein